VWRLLGRTLVVPTLESAVMLRAVLPAGFRFVTRSGEVLEADGRVIAGPQVESAAGVGGLIARRSQLAHLQAELAQVDESIQRDQQQLAGLSDKASHTEAVMAELRNGIYEANTVRVELHSRLENLGAAIAKLEREQPVIAGETEQIHRQLRDADSKRSVHADEARKPEEASATRQALVAELEAQIAELAKHAEELRDTVTGLRVESGRLGEQHGAAERQV